MTKEEAHKVLDAARAGVPTPDWRINAALVETGDLCWSETRQQSRKSIGSWEGKEPVEKVGLWDGLAA